MFHCASRVTAVTAACVFMLPRLAAADAINLKLSFFTSDRSQIYQCQVKPFVDAVNAEGGDLVHIEVFFSGAISAELSQLPQLVSSGAADLALIVPGRTPDRFNDTSVMELPGLFHNAREADFVFTQLVGRGMLSGYDDFYVIGASVSGAESIHSRKPIASIADLKGLTIRVNNPTEAEVLQRLEAIPVLLSINQTTEAVSNGKIDGATLPPSMLHEFGVGRVATYHFMIALGGAPVALVMNRQRFESLSPAAQAIVRKYSGGWVGEQATKRLDELDRKVLETLKADPGRTVIFPSATDNKAIDAVYAEVIEQWAASSDYHRELLTRVRALLAKLRTTE